MKREQVSKLPGWYTSCLSPSSPVCEKGSIQGHSVGRGGGGTSLAVLTQRGGKYPRRKEKHGGPEFAMGTTAWAPHSPSVGATVCLLQESRQLPGALTATWLGAEAPTCGVQMTTPPTAGVPGKNRRAGCTCILSGGHCWLPGAPEPPQGCSAPPSASAGVY